MVRDTVGNLVSGILVKAWSDVEEISAEITTDPDGIFKLRGLPDAFYTLKAQGRVGTAQLESVGIFGGNVVEQDLIVK